MFGQLKKKCQIDKLNVFYMPKNKNYNPDQFFLGETMLPRCPSKVSSTIELSQFVLLVGART